MYLDRQDVAFRKGEGNLKEKEITIYRPWDRRYPNFRGYKEWEVVKARIIDKLWNDKQKIAPVFSKEVELFKVFKINVYPSCKLNTEIIKDLKNKYWNNIDLSTITEIKMCKVNLDKMNESNKKIEELFKKWILTLARLPEDNITSLDELLSSDNFSITLINHDYAWITPKMWNFISNEYNLNIKNTMAIAKPDDLEYILNIFNITKWYIWWWFGVWFKDVWWKILKENKNFFVNPVADIMQSVNFISHFWNELHWYNSDAVWYCQSLTDKFVEIWDTIKNKNILLIWAWWTARWIALELVNRWINKLIISNRTVAKAEEIADKLNKIRPWVCEVLNEDIPLDLDLDAIVNVSIKWADWKFEKFSALAPTSVNIEDNISLSQNILEVYKKKNKQIIISDINLTKSWTTPLLSMAHKLWLQTLDGKLMVVYQWVEAIWTVFWDKIIKQWWTKEEIRQKLLKFIINDKK